MLLLFYFNELHQRIKNILIVKKLVIIDYLLMKKVEKHY